VVLRRTHVHPLLLVAVLLLPGPQPTTADVSMSFGGGGCAVGYRSGFTDEASFPCFAACSAPPGRSPPFSGDVGGPVARGLCAPGWHVCTVGSARNARFEARCVAPAVRLLLGMWGHAAVAVGRGACAFLIVLHNLHGVDVAVGVGRCLPLARHLRPLPVFASRAHASQEYSLSQLLDDYGMVAGQPCHPHF
jgi:hypothetical protein